MDSCFQQFSFPVLVENMKLKIIYIYTNLEIPAFFFFSMIKQRSGTWRFGRKKKKKGTLKISGTFVICWWGSPTSTAEAPACAPSIPFVLKSTFLTVRHHSLKASQGNGSQDNKFKVALKTNHLKVAHCCVSQPTNWFWQIK